MTPQDFAILRMNKLRRAIRDAQNVAKSLEWVDDLNTAKIASSVWDDLEQIFKRLGGFR